MPAPPPKNRTRAGSRRLLLLGGRRSIAAIAVIWAAIFLHLYGQRQDAIAAALKTATGLAGAYEESASRGVRDIEQTLLYVRALRARDGAALDLAPWVNSVELATRVALPIRITDRRGSVTLSDLRRPTEPIDLSERPYIRHFADAASAAGTRPLDDRLFIGAPVSVLARWSVTFARPLMTAKGAFDGVVSVTVDPDSLIPSSRTIDVGPRGVVTLTGLDGIVLARVGGAATVGGGPAIGGRAVSPAVERATAEVGGCYDWFDPGDGVRRIASFRRVAGYPLLVEVALAADDVLPVLHGNLVAMLAAGLVLSVAVAVDGAVASRRALRMADTQRMLNAMLDHVDHGLIMVDPRGRIAVLNHRAAELLDLPARFVAGERFATLVDWQRRQGEFSNGEPPAVLPHLMVSRPALIVPQCYQRTRPNGRVLEVRILALAEDWTMCTYRDVTPAAATAEKVAQPNVSVESTPVEPSRADHLAVEHLTGTLGSDAVAGIVATFLEALPRRLGRMRDLAEAGDTDPLLREAHSLADSAATIGLDELGAAASELEEDLKWRRVDATAARLDRIDRFARSGVDRLAAFLQKTAA